MSDDVAVTETPEPDQEVAEGTAVAEEGMSRRTLIILICVAAGVLALIGLALAWYLITGKSPTQIPGLSKEIPPHYSRAIYDVSAPLGVALDEKNDRVYITQSSGERKVAIFTLDGTRIGNLPAPGNAKVMHMPIYVAVDPLTQDVIVTDRAAAALYQYDSSGNYLRTVLPRGVAKWNPLGLCFDSSGLLYVADVSGKIPVIYQMKTNGEVIRKLGAKDKLSFVNGLVVQSNGTLAAADSNAGRVLIYGASPEAEGGLARGKADAPLGLPRGLAVDDRERLYVVDTVNQIVRVYLPADDGTQIPVYAFSFGGQGTADGAFEYPNGIAVTSRNQLFITDRGNNRVQVWSY